VIPVALTKVAVFAKCLKIVNVSRSAFGLRHDMVYVKFQLTVFASGTATRKAGVIVTLKDLVAKSLRNLDLLWLRGRAEGFL
jgi:hypothetical protein